LPTVTVNLGTGASVVFGCSDPPRVSDGDFVMTVTGSVSTPTDVHLAWSGTAVPGSDYATPPNSITLSPGTTDVTVPVHLLGSDAPSKTVVLTLETGTGYHVGDPASATMTIVVALPSCPLPPPPLDTNPTFTG